jgi:hypothetical protein
MLSYVVCVLNSSELLKKRPKKAAACFAKECG